jgi:hypothetical protein
MLTPQREALIECGTRVLERLSLQIIESAKYLGNDANYPGLDAQRGPSVIFNFSGGKQS